MIGRLLGEVTNNKGGQGKKGHQFGRKITPSRPKGKVHLSPGKGSKDFVKGRGGGHSGRK